MDIVSSDWSNRHKELSMIIRKTDYFTKIITMILDLHKELHTSKVSNSANNNKIDMLFDDLLPKDYAIMPTKKDETIAWAIWHITRIEDLTMNILINNDAQVFDEAWKKRMNITLADTGNAMTDEEIMQFSKEVNIAELLKYRDAVGMKSQIIVKNLRFEDMKRRVSPEGISRISQEGGVTNQDDSIWLLDFWGKKDVAGILLMPLTRHQTLHLNDCDKWKNYIRTRSKFYAI